MNLDTTVVLSLPPLSANDDGTMLAMSAFVMGLVRRGHQVIAVCDAEPAAMDQAVRLAQRATAQDAAASIASDRAVLLNEPALDETARITEELRNAGVAAVTTSKFPFSRGGPLSAEPRRLPASAIAKAFESADVVVFPGGVGVDDAGRDAVHFGEGGAALTAVFVAGRLGVPLERLDLNGDGLDPLPRRASLLAGRLGVTPRITTVDAGAAASLAGGRSLSGDLAESGIASISGALEAGKATAHGSVVVLSPRRAADAVARGDRTSGEVSPAATGAIPAAEVIRVLKGVDPVVLVRMSVSPAAASVFDAVAHGIDPLDALATAREDGLTAWSEAGELDGSVAAQRLAIIASEAFGTSLDWRSIPTRGARVISTRDVEKASASGRRYRLIATAERRPGPNRTTEIFTRVGPLPVKTSSALAARGPFGAVEIVSASGRVITLRGGVAGWSVYNTLVRSIGMDREIATRHRPSNESVEPIAIRRDGPLSLMA